MPNISCDSQGFTRLAWPFIFPDYCNLNYIIRPKWDWFLKQWISLYECVISYFVSISIRLHFFQWYFYSLLHCVEEIILFPFKCAGQVSQGLKIHFPNVLALWVRIYNLFLVALCLKEKTTLPFPDSVEGWLLSEGKTSSQSAVP